MWQDRLHPYAVFTETSEGFAPYYLAGSAMIWFRPHFGDRALCHMLCSCAIVSQKSPDRLVTVLLPVVYLACVVPATL